MGQEANNLRDHNKEPDFTALTKFVVNKAKLANTEYGRLVNVKSDWERNKPKSYSKPTRNVSAYQVSNRPANEEREGKRNPVTRLRCIFCSKDGHSLGRCFMFQEKSYAERKRFILEKGLCKICLSKGHFASKCQRGRKCFIVGCGRRHHPLLHSSKLKQNKQDEDSTKANEVNDQKAQAEAEGPNARMHKLDTVVLPTQRNDKSV